jgi:hypothetical protein
VRRTQILDACEAIVLEEGLASASAARVAGRAEVREVQAERGSKADVAEIIDFLLSPDFSQPR